MLFSNKNSSDVKFEVIFSGVVVLVKIVWSSVGNVEDRGKNNFSFGVEMDPVHWRVGLPRKAFVEVNVVFIIDIVLFS